MNTLNYLKIGTKVSGKVKEEITKLKGKVKPTDTMSVLNNLDVKSSLELHAQFCIITCDKRRS